MKLLNIEEELTVLLEEAKKLVSTANELSSLEQLKVKYFGKKGELTEILRNLGQVPADEKPKLGKVINQVKVELQNLINEKENVIQQAVLERKLASEKIDITLPGRAETLGSLHPVTQVKDRIVSLFASMGFVVAEGPEIEDDFHNFVALNIPPHHPARASQATFYFPNGKLLRTHTSPVQIRVMTQQKPPFRVITPGRVYRRDMDPTHTPMFHQIEGLVVDEHCTFANLKAILHDFLSRFFGTEMKLRFRPSYFPFTEPSAEVDIAHQCSEKPCRVCKDTGWLEVLGCGMVHPQVLKNVNIDPEKYSGFAFGVGLDRLAMLRYGIDDLRLLFENDLRLLQQFKA